MPSKARLSFYSVSFLESDAFSGARKSNSSTAPRILYFRDQKGLQSERLKALKFGRDAEIRTRDLTHPKGARYQAAPRPVRTLVSREKLFCQIGDARSIFGGAGKQIQPAGVLTAKRLQVCVTIVEQQ